MFPITLPRQLSRQIFFLRLKNFQIWRNSNSVKSHDKYINTPPNWFSCLISHLYNNQDENSSWNKSLYNSTKHLNIRKGLLFLFFKQATKSSIKYPIGDFPAYWGKCQQLVKALCFSFDKINILLGKLDLIYLFWKSYYISPNVFFVYLSLSLSLQNKMIAKAMTNKFSMGTNGFTEHVFSRLVFEIPKLFSVFGKGFDFPCKYNAKLNSYFLSICLVKLNLPFFFFNYINVYTCISCNFLKPKIYLNVRGLHHK